MDNTCSCFALLTPNKDRYWYFFFSLYSKWLEKIWSPSHIQLILSLFDLCLSFACVSLRCVKLFLSLSCVRWKIFISTLCNRKYLKHITQLRYVGNKDQNNLKKSSAYIWAHLAFWNCLFRSLYCGQTFDQNHQIIIIIRFQQKLETVFQRTSFKVQKLQENVN